jgi:hypothetical protein
MRTQERRFWIFADRWSIVSLSRLYKMQMTEQEATTQAIPIRNEIS